MLAGRVMLPAGWGRETLKLAWLGVLCFGCLPTKDRSDGLVVRTECESDVFVSTCCAVPLQQARELKTQSARFRPSAHMTAPAAQRMMP